MVLSKKSYYFIVFLFFIPYIYTHAQNFELKLASKDSILNNELSLFNFNKKFNSEKNAIKKCDSISHLLTSKGYFGTYYKSKTKDSTIITNFYYIKKFDTLKIRFNNEVVKKVLNREIIKSSNNIFEVPTYKIDTLLNKIVSAYESEGFTFTTARLTNFKIVKTKIEADLIIKVQNKRKINKIVVNGYDEFSSKKIKKILAIRDNAPFNVLTLETIEKKIKESEYFGSIKKPEVLFTKDSTHLYIYLKKESNSKFDGIIGFSNEDEDKLQLNGYLNLQLFNVFNSAEEISINWIGNKQQKTLNINYNIPYIFKTNFNFEGNFGLVRKDSTYVNSQVETTIGYLLKNNAIIGSVLNLEKSNITNQNDNLLIKNYSKVFYGVSFKHYIFERNHVSNKKLNLEAKATVGNRKNDNIKTNQQQYALKFSYLQKLTKNNYLYLKSNSAYLVTDSPFNNEHYKIGGFNSLRGFNEESILTTKYTTNSLEYHYLTNSDSYLYSFFDIGLVNSKIKNSTLNLYGFGIGYNFLANNSIINIAYALGKFDKSPIKLQNSKFHIQISYLF